MNLVPVQKSQIQQALFFIGLFIFLNSIFVVGGLIDREPVHFMTWLSTFYTTGYRLPALSIVLILIPLSITVGIFHAPSRALALHVITYVLVVLLVVLAFNDSEGLALLGYIVAFPASLLAMYLGLLLGRLYFSSSSTVVKVLIILGVLCAGVFLTFNYTILY